MSETQEFLQWVDAQYPQITIPSGLRGLLLGFAFPIATVLTILAIVVPVLAQLYEIFVAAGR